MANQEVNYKEYGENLLNDIIAATTIKAGYQALHKNGNLHEANEIKKAILGDKLSKIALNLNYSPYLQAAKFKEATIYQVDYSIEEIAFAIENLILGFIQLQRDNLPTDDVDRLAFNGALLSYKREYYDGRIRRMGENPTFNHGMRRMRIK